MKYAASFAAFALILVIMRGLAPMPVFAHARYDTSSPGKGEILGVSPALVEITFTQDIQKRAGTFDIAVNKDRGPSVTSGPAVVNEEDRRKLSVPLQGGLADGRYVVNFKNVSDEDGDPFEGAFSFYINYQPNAVDLENDAQLEQIGAEDATPLPNESVAVTVTTVPSTTSVVAETSSSASPTPTESANEEGGSNTTLVITILFVGVVAAVALGGAFVLRRSRNQ